MAALTDQFTLSSDAVFQGRVEQSMLAAAIAVSAEADTTAHHAKRVALATKVLLGPAPYTTIFAKAVASDSAIAATAPTGAAATDAQINAAVSAVWDAMAGARSS